MQKSLDIVPQNLSFSGITGFPSPFNVPPVSIPRNFQASNSIRLGGEYTVLHDPIGVDLRGGINYESSAIPSDYQSALTTDLDHVTLALGVGVRPIPALRIDALFAHVFGFTEEVDPKTAGISAVNPLRGNPVVPVAINAGTYASHANIAGLGATYKF